MSRRIPTLLTAAFLAAWPAGGAQAAEAVLSTPGPVLPPSDAPPVVLVHGIWDTGRVWDALVAKLASCGRTQVAAIDLVPNDGRLGLAMLARQVEDAATRLQAETGAARVDVVGFSMGTLVSRWWLQKLGGRERTRRFVAISGPQHGTWTAYFNGTAGGRDMRPDSVFLRELYADPAPFGDVEVTSFWTPMDLMIVPSWSSAIEGSRKRRFWVPLHPWMTSDTQVVQAVTDELCRP